MYGYRRSRVDLDADSHETFRYFSLLRGVPVGAALRRVLALHAATIEKEFPPIRAHMLAWRAAQEAKRTGSDARERWDAPITTAADLIAAEPKDDLDSVPF